MPGIWNSLVGISDCVETTSSSSAAGFAGTSMACNTGGPPGCALRGDSSSSVPTTTDGSLPGGLGAGARCEKTCGADGRGAGALLPVPSASKVLVRPCITSGSGAPKLANGSGGSMVAPTIGNSCVLLLSLAGCDPGMAINTVGCESGSLFAGANAANGSGAADGACFAGGFGASLGTNAGCSEVSGASPNTGAGPPASACLVWSSH
jgi:hypothetical protein